MNLQPCPFCGSTQLGYEWRDGIPVGVGCNNCGAIGPWVYQPHAPDGTALARELWNERSRNE